MTTRSTQTKFLGVLIALCASDYLLPLSFAADPSPSPSPSVSPSASPSPSQSPSPSASPSPSPSVSPSVRPSPSIIPSPSITPSPRPSVSVSPLPRPFSLTSSHQGGVSGANNTVGLGIAASSDGSTLVTGTTTGGLDGNTKTTTGSTTEVFVTKYSSLGAKEWTRQFGASETQSTNSPCVAVDSTNNIYIAGTTTGTLSGATRTADSERAELFITKYDPSGTKQWTQQLGVAGSYDVFAGGSTGSTSNCIAFDPSGFLYFAGYTNGTMDSNSKTSAAGSNDFFLAKYDTDGNKQWVSQLGAPGSNSTLGIAVTLDPSSDVYIAGGTTGSLDGKTKTSDATKNDAFVTKYNSSGTKQWTQQFGSSGNNDTTVFSIEAGSGNFYASGFTTGTLPGNTKSSATGNNDSFLVKFDLTGNSLWTKQYGTSGKTDTNSLGLKIDSNGNPILAGSTNGTLAGKVSNPGNTDGYLIRFDRNGNVLLTTQFGVLGGNKTTLGNLAMDPFGNLFVSGSTTGAFAGNAKTSNASYLDYIIAEFEP